MYRNGKRTKTLNSDMPGAVSDPWQGNLLKQKAANSNS